MEEGAGLEWHMGASELERTIIGNFSESFNAKGSAELECWLEGSARATGGFRPTLEDTNRVCADGTHC